MFGSWERNEVLSHSQSQPRTTIEGRVSIEISSLLCCFSHFDLKDLDFSLPGGSKSLRKKKGKSPGGKGNSQGGVQATAAFTLQPSLKDTSLWVSRAFPGEALPSASPTSSYATFQPDSTELQDWAVLCGDLISPRSACPHLGKH